MQQQVLSITQLNEYIQRKMDSDPMLGAVAVRGEISNYKCYPSGHHYFTLKDESSALKCVMFRGNASRLKFRPENGMKIIAMGKVSVFPRDGAYQLYCTAMAMDGVGDLYAAFEQLKAKLQAQGLFDPAHKKPLPKYPGTIGIITSSAGAAVHPYVLLNYTGTLDSQFTLAHEMGHALHSYLSNKNQNPIDADYVIFVAEVASTCNEALLMEHLLGKTTDKKERAYLINHFLDQFKGTL